MAQLRQQLSAARAKATALECTLRDREAVSSCAGSACEDIIVRAAFEELQAKAEVLELQNAGLRHDAVRVLYAARTGAHPCVRCPASSIGGAQL